VKHLVAMLFILVSLPFGLVTAGQGGCVSAFEDVRDFVAAVFEKSTAEIVDGVVEWDSTDWEEIVWRVVGTSEFYLNNCTNADQPLTEQLEEVAKLAEMSLIPPPIAALDLGEGFSVPLTSDITPVAEFIDLDGDDSEEVLLHTQVPYFSQDTLYSIYGGLSIAFFYGEDGWQGHVIAPVTGFVTDEMNDHVSFAMVENNTLSVEESHQALGIFPLPSVEVFFADDGETPLTAITLYTLTGPGEAKELNILSWENGIPSVELRIAFDDWCYPGSALDWEIREDGSVFVPSNGGEEGSPLHCGRTPEILYIWEDGQYKELEQ
jgi:hypothetical protein